MADTGQLKDNQRVTNAQIFAKLEYLELRFTQWHDEMCVDANDREMRLRTLEKLVERHDAELERIKDGATIKSIVSAAVAGLGAAIFSLWER